LLFKYVLTLAKLTCQFLNILRLLLLDQSFIIGYSTYDIVLH